MPFSSVAILAATLAIATTATTSCQETGGPPVADAFTVVALPDTQYYAAAHPEILDAQVRWILQNRVQQRIVLIVHEGDIVDADEPRQWERAARSLRALDGRVPYVLGTGNHDYRRAGKFISRRTSINDFFPIVERSPGVSFGGTFEPGHIENTFEIVDTGEGSWLVLSLEFGPRDAVLSWADGVAKRYASLPAIVLTHAYLASDDTRYDHVLRSDQLWNPHHYLDDAAPGEANDGEEIWRKLVSRNDNILFVLCGHDLGDGVGRLTSLRKDGTSVHQILANYQTEALGGLGYLRLMRFTPSEGRVRVQTYSPLLNRFKVDAGNDFQLDYSWPSSPRVAARDRHLDKRPESASKF